MPIKIPRLQEIQTNRTTPQNDRITSNVPDDASNIVGRTNAITSLGTTALNIHQEYEKKKIDQLSYADELEYSTWHYQELEKLNQVKDADPTDIYVDFEKKENDKYNEILNKRPDLSENVRRGIASKLTRARDADRIQMLKQRGLQTEVYKNNNYESILALKKEKLAFSAADVRPREEGVFDEHIKDIKEIIASRGKDTGGVTVDSEGKEVWSDIYQARLNKELGQGVKVSVNAALDAGEKDQAILVYDRYKKYLSPEDNAAFLKKLEAQGKKDDAYQIVGRIEGLDKDKQLEAIDNIKDPETKNEVLKIKNDNETRRASLTTMRQDLNFDETHKLVREMKDNGQVYGMTEVMNNPQIKGMWDKLSAKQQKTIEEEFKTPKESDEKALVNLMEIFSGENSDINLKQLSPSKFVELTQGLNKTDKDKFTTRFMNAKKDTEGKNDRFVKLSKRLEDKLLAFEIVGKAAKPEGQRKEKILKARVLDELYLRVDDLPPTATAKETDQVLNTFLGELQKEKIFGRSSKLSEKLPKERGFFSRLFGSEESPKPVTKFKESANVTLQEAVKTVTNNTGKPKPNPFQGMETRKIIPLQMEFRKLNNLRNPPTINDPVFQEWYRKKLGM